MVARLVEQHGVGAHEQDAGERDAHLPAARQRADVAVHHRFGEVEAGQHLARAALERVAAELLEAVLRLAVALDDRVHRVGLLGIGHRGLERRRVPPPTTLTGPAPSITSATALRPAISPTSWLK